MLERVQRAQSRPGEFRECQLEWIIGQRASPHTMRDAAKVIWITRRELTRSKEADKSERKEEGEREASSSRCMTENDGPGLELFWGSRRLTRPRP